jgi:hypothetical protein
MAAIAANSREAAAGRRSAADATISHASILTVG